MCAPCIKKKNRAPFQALAHRYCFSRAVYERFPGWRGKKRIKVFMLRYASSYFKTTPEFHHVCVFGWGIPVQFRTFPTSSFHFWKITSNVGNISIFYFLSLFFVSSQLQHHLPWSCQRDWRFRQYMNFKSAESTCVWDWEQVQESCNRIQDKAIRRHCGVKWVLGLDAPLCFGSVIYRWSVAWCLFFILLRQDWSGKTKP